MTLDEAKALLSSCERLGRDREVNWYELENGPLVAEGYFGYGDAALVNFRRSGHSFQGKDAHQLRHCGKEAQR